MGPDEIKLFLSYVGVFSVGGIIAGGIVFFLLKSFIPSYLNEKGKNLATREDIAKITNEIEGVRLQYAMFLKRRSCIFERQVELLGKLYKCLSEVQEYSKAQFQAVNPIDEKPDEYQLGLSLKEARNEFVTSRLFLPVDVTGQVDTFFQKIDEGRWQRYLAQNTTVSDIQARGQFWEKAVNIIHHEVPALLRIIEEQARKLLHDK